jgi:hypothetical protein
LVYEQVGTPIGIEIDGGYLNGIIHWEFQRRPKTPVPMTFEDPEALAVNGS